MNLTQITIIFITVSKNLLEEVALIVNKRVQNIVLGCNLKNDRIISVHFQGKPFNSTAIQVYAPNSNAEKSEVEWFCEELQDGLELTPKKDVLFIVGDWNGRILIQMTIISTTAGRNPLEEMD